MILQNKSSLRERYLMLLEENNRIANENMELVGEISVKYLSLSKLTI